MVMAYDNFVRNNKEKEPCPCWNSRCSWTIYIYIYIYIYIVSEVIFVSLNINQCHIYVNKK